MAYMALYRKWRPQDFNNLIGQEHIRKTLANAIEQGKVAHAYLFSGSRGTGKTSTAKILAKALNCEQGPTATPCNTCSNCEKINNGSFMDVFEIDAASNRGIDEIRELRETVKFAPVDGKYKVYIIDEVHMLTTEAFNALLKTLEEPPSHVVFILATTEVHKVPITIQSRCQRYDFKRITKDDILARLREVMGSTDIEADEKALELIAIQSDGGMRDALSLLDQCLAFANGNLTVEEVHKVLGLVGNNWIWQLTDQIIAKKEAEILDSLNELIAQGKDLKQIISEFILHLRSLMIFKATKRMANMEVYLEDEEVLKRQAGALAHSRIVALIQLANDTLNALKWAPHGRIALETMFLKMCWQESENNAAEVNFQEQKEHTEAVENNYLMGKIKALEDVIQNLAQELNYLKNTGVTVQTSTPKQKEASANVNTNENVSSNAMAVPSLNSAPINGADFMASLAKLSAQPTPATQMATPAITPLKKSGDKQENHVEIHVPANLKMAYNGNLHQLWQRVKQVINQTKGLIGLSRVMADDVVPYQITNNQFYLNMTKPFVYHRLAQNTRQLEECIAKIANLNVRVVLMVNNQVMDEFAGATVEMPPASIAKPPAAEQEAAPTVVEAPPVMVEEEILEFDAPPPEDDYFEDITEPLPPSIPQMEPVEINTDGNALDKAMDIFGAQDYEVVEE